MCLYIINPGLFAPVDARRFRPRLAWLPIVWLALVCLPAQAAQEPPVAAAACTGCHGPGGVSNNPWAPSLAGQPYTLIEDNLIAFRAGKRSCSKERMDDSAAGSLSRAMCLQVGQLADADIAALAQWFSSRMFVPVSQPFDPGGAESGSRLHLELGCDRCHADGGRETLGMAPVLAGQWTPFLRRALYAFRDGTRRGPVMMNTPIQALSDDQVEALLNYYASRAVR